MDLINVDYRKMMWSAATRYCKRHGITIGTLGKKLASDRKFFLRVRDGAGCTVDTFQRIMRALLSDRPIKERVAT